MPQQTPHSNTAAEILAQNGAWREFFTSSRPTGLSPEHLAKVGPEAHSYNLLSLSKDTELLKRAVQEALSLEAWDFIGEVFGQKFSALCRPENLLRTPSFVAPISSSDRDLSTTDRAKLTLWRSVLVGNPWYAITLTERDIREWNRLSTAVLQALCASETRPGYLGFPLHLVHAIDAVNLALQTKHDQITNGVQEARVSAKTIGHHLVDLIARHGDSLSFSARPLRELSLSPMSQDSKVRKDFFEGIITSHNRPGAERILHLIAVSDGPISEWKIRASAAHHLTSISKTPVQSAFNLLEHAVDPAVKEVALHIISSKLKFPISADMRTEIALLNTKGGNILSQLLAGTDQSHRWIGWVDNFAPAVRQWILACRAARVPHGIDEALIRNLGLSAGGPLNDADLEYALEPLDWVSLGYAEGFIRRVLKA